MGMPRELRDECKDFIRTCSREELVSLAVTAGIRFGEKANEILEKLERTHCSSHIFTSLMKGRIRQLNIQDYRSDCVDSMNRIEALLYTGLAGQALTPEYRKVSIPKFFAPKLEALNKTRLARDQQDQALLSKIRTVRNKVYASRIFPPVLRNIIFERDNFTCQSCLRGREVLRRLGLHLEVDHIDAWIDGGLTTYSNGSTLCNECNSAKHHGKAYWGAIRLVN